MRWCHQLPSKLVFRKGKQPVSKDAIERGEEQNRRREKWPKQSWEEGEIKRKSREEGEIESSVPEAWKKSGSRRRKVIILKLPYGYKSLYYNVNVNAIHNYM